MPRILKKVTIDELRAKYKSVEDVIERFTDDLGEKPEDYQFGQIQTPIGRKYVAYKDKTAHYYYDTDDGWNRVGGGIGPLTEDNLMKDLLESTQADEKTLTNLEGVSVVCSRKHNSGTGYDNSYDKNLAATIEKYKKLASSDLNQAKLKAEKEMDSCVKTIANKGLTLGRSAKSDALFLSLSKIIPVLGGTLKKEYDVSDWEKLPGWKSDGYF